MNKKLSILVFGIAVVATTVSHPFAISAALIESTGVNLTVTICNDPCDIDDGNTGGGSGGGGITGPITPILPNISEGVIVKGIAYPGSTVTLLKDGQLVASTQAGP